MKSIVTLRDLGWAPGGKRNKERKYFSEVVLGAQRKGPELKRNKGELQNLN